MKGTIWYIIVVFLMVASCKTSSTPTSNGNYKSNKISSIQFLDELIIPNNLIYDSTQVGGLSSIDYYNNAFYIISDDRKTPRYYKAIIPISTKGFGKLNFEEVVFLKDINNVDFEEGNADPESLRIVDNQHILWSSEGNVNQSINPFIRKATLNGSYVNDAALPSQYTLNANNTSGPRNNGVFEALSLDRENHSFWTAIELPLIQDGPPPTSLTSNAYVRVSEVDATTLNFKREFAYPLDKVARKGNLEVNGITEILKTSETSMLILERSYASGYQDGGNDIKIYIAEHKKATDVLDINSLSSSPFKPMSKKLLLDLDTIRDQLTGKIIDNIEGITFGPILENGNKSLILISDNNFNSFGSQITQLLLFEVR